MNGTPKKNDTAKKQLYELRLIEPGKRITVSSGRDH